jgi:hypothetical protein
MFNATIIKTDGTEFTFESPTDFMTFWYDNYNKVQNIHQLGDVASIIYGGLISSYYVPYITSMFKLGTDVEKVLFKGFKICEQHKDKAVYCLTREAAKNFFRMAGVKEARSLAGATYYHDGHAWETRTYTLEI